VCIGIPLRVVEAWSERALVTGRGRSETVDTRLVGACAPGEWLLVFQGAARERLDAQRAAEILSALELLEAGLAGDAVAASAAPAFELPSSLSAAQLAALTGAPQPPSGDPT
jgi:hydrogenase expression/formation protein HypC